MLIIEIGKHPIYRLFNSIEVGLCGNFATIVHSSDMKIIHQEFNQSLILHESHNSSTCRSTTKSGYLASQVS